MCITENEDNYAVAERFIRDLKNQFYRYETNINEKLYSGKLHDILKVKIENITLDTDIVILLMQTKLNQILTYMDHNTKLEI